MRKTPRVRAAVIAPAVLSLLVASATATAPVGASASASRVEQAWTASVGVKGANGTASVRILDTGAGAVALSLRGLAAGKAYAIAIRAGACAKLGVPVATFGTVKASAKGVVGATLPLTAAQAEAVRGAAVGTRRISLVAGGSAAPCGTLVKSMAVTPRIWFGPLPGWSPPASFPGTNGAVDFGDLFSPNAPWQRVAGATHVFMLYPGTSPDTPTAWLRQMVDALEARQIRLALDMWMLEPENGCGVGVNGFGMGADAFIALVRRIESVGGTVSYVSLANPFWAGVRDNGPNACHWSVETVARKVGAWVGKVRAAFPRIEIGLIEQYYGPASVADVEQWIAAYDEAVGGRIPFFHLDVDFTSPGWTEGAARIADWVRARGTRFGLFYTSWPPAESDAEWFAGASANVEAFELDGGGPPDDAIFESWTDKPDHVLPETGPTTMTRLIADYVRTRTTASATEGWGEPFGTIEMTGHVRTLGGEPVTGGSVAVTATPRDGPFQVMEFTGTVPAGAAQGLIAIRVNREGAGPGPADLSFYEVGYAEGAEAGNRVPNGGFGWGWEGRREFGTLEPSDRGNGTMLRLVVTPAQDVGLESAPYPVTPGTRYRLWVAVRVPEASAGSAYIAPIFLESVETRRHVYPLVPQPIAVGTATTDPTGAWSLSTTRMETGRYRVLAEYAGDARFWPARARVELSVP